MEYQIFHLGLLLVLHQQIPILLVPNIKDNVKTINNIYIYIIRNRKYFNKILFNIKYIHFHYYYYIKKKYIDTYINEHINTKS